jgi:phosphate transport system substrate-binding protein
MKKSKMYLSAYSCFFTVLSVTGIFLPCNIAAQTAAVTVNSDTLKIGVAVTTRYLMQLATPVFAAAYPAIPLRSKTDETGNVVDNVITGKASLAVTTRNLKDFEIKKSAAAMGTPIGYDGLVLAVSKTIKINSLTFEQVAGIWTGEFVNWNQLGGPDLPITVIGRTKAYDPIQLFADFMKLDCKHSEKKVQYSVKGKENWTQHAAPATETDEAALSLLKKIPGAVTYFPLQIFYNCNKKRNAIKALDFNGVKAAAATIANGSYFINRRLNVITQGKPEGSAKTFVDFLLSEKGQRIIKAAGFLPLRY